MKFHWFTAAGNLSFPGSGTKYFSATGCTAISLTQLTCHLNNYLHQPSYFFSSMGCPQQWIVPLPPLVTINSEPHFAQRYLLPTWFANFLPPFHLLFINPTRYAVFQPRYYKTPIASLSKSSGILNARLKSEVGYLLGGYLQAGSGTMW